MNIGESVEQMPEVIEIGNFIPEKEVIKSPERENSIKLLSVKFENSSLENTLEARVARSIFEGLNAARIWSVETAKTPLPDSFDPNSTPDKVNHIEREADKVINLFSDMGNFLNVYNENREDPSKLASSLSIEEEKIRARTFAVLSSAGYVDIPEKSIDVIFKNHDQLQYFVDTYAHRINHDTRNPLTYIKLSAQLIKSLPHKNYTERKDLVNNTIANLGNHIEGLVNVTKKNVTVDEIKMEFYKRVKSHLNRELRMLGGKPKYHCVVDPRIKNSDKKIQVVWSAKDLEAVINNLLDNASKSHQAGRLRQEQEIHEMQSNHGQKRLDTDDDHQNSALNQEIIDELLEGNEYLTELWLWLSENGKNLEVSIADNGIGFPEDVVNHGFEAAYREKKTGFGDTRIPTGGTGLKDLKKDLERKYRGNLIPRNINKNGEIVGARITAELPINESDDVDGIDLDLLPKVEYN